MEEVIKPEAFVLNVMRQKLHPQFIYSPPEEYEPPQGRNSKSARDNNDALRGKVNSWVKEGYVEKLPTKPLFFNPMTVASKFDPVTDKTKLCPCIDLSRCLNFHIDKAKIKLDGLSSCQRTLERFDFMTVF